MYYSLINHLDAPDGTPADKAQVETRFNPFGDSDNLNARLR
jgi:hypothetical protein